MTAGSIVVIGLPYVIAKWTYLPGELARFGITTVYYTPTAHVETTLTDTGPGVETELGESGMFRDLLAFYRVLRRWKPKHVQVSFNAPRVTPYTFIAWAFGYRTVVWCQGGEVMYWDTQPKLRRALHALIFRFSRMVMINELYMEDFIRGHHLVHPRRLAFFHSRIRTSNDGSLERPEKVVLYLNTFKHWRHPELVVKAAPSILERVPDAKIILAGDTGIRPKVEGQIKQLIEDLDLRGRVVALPFTDHPRQYYDAASVFVLPADIVFCNFALLEAMDRYVVPVVADVSGADRIVEPGVSGFLVPQTPDAIAEAVTRVLTDEELRRRLATAAHAKIAEAFDVSRSAPEILRLYSGRVWR